MNNIICIVNLFFHILIYFINFTFHFFLSNYNHLRSIIYFEIYLNIF